MLKFRRMRCREWLLAVMLATSVGTREASGASPAPLCHLYDAHDCLTRRREDPRRPQAAYVKRCCPRGSLLLLNQTCGAGHSTAADVAVPRVARAEGVWEEQPLLLTCREQEGSSLVRRTLNLSTVLSADHDNVVQLETAAGLVSLDYCVGVVGGGGGGAGLEAPVEEPQDQTTAAAPPLLTEAVHEAQTGPGRRAPYHYVALFCATDLAVQRPLDRKLCRDTPCARKCCPLGKFLKYNDTNTGVCIYTRTAADDWTPQNSSFSRDVPSDMRMVFTIPRDRPCYVLHEFLLLGNGNLEIEGSFQMSLDDYCIDFEVSQGVEGRREAARICPDPKVCWWKNELQDVIFLSVSCVFLLLTVVAYVGTPALRGTNSSRCLVALVVSRLLASLINIATNLTRTFLSSETHLCSMAAFVNLAFILSTFFWLNVTCFDIWLTITCRQQGRKDSVKVFALYWTYAWVCPLLLAGLALALDAIPEGLQVWPVFAEAACWFISYQTRWAYKHSVILILLLINLGFFVHVFYSLHKQLNSKELNNDTSHITRPKAVKWRMFCNLFIVMGMVWVIQIPLPGTSVEVCVWWRVILDAITDLHGVSIFVVTVCNEDKWNKVRKGPLRSIWCFIWRPPTVPSSRHAHPVSLYTINRNVPSFRERWNDSDTHL